ncbi:hypothetical protein PoMZ_09176 [Pyricularia oryzae]|uniref:Uncharacterized protein n=1 Tax=Pyricularia oryzae TaxID=318829 RepID=A0A4V1C4N4_PYROR|nr:hypothetical protein PoMZ_09176 [Pyricularia oryzae]
MWLLFRVSLQFFFGHETASISQARYFYKLLMLFFTISLFMDGFFYQDLFSDIIEIIKFKVARRKYKLFAAFQGKVEEQIILFANKVIINAARKLINRQRSFVANESPDNKLRRFKSVNFINNTVHRLKNLDEFIKSILNRTINLDKAFFCPPAYMSIFSKNLLPNFFGWSTFDIYNYTAFRFAKVEIWVSNHLDNWLNQAIINKNACSELFNLIITYEKIAISVYKTNSEKRLIIILVLIKFWVVCDKIATGLFESFLLPFRKQMAKLNRRRAKIAEFSKIQAEYRRFYNFFELENCRYIELLNKNGRPYITHSPNCSKCSYQKQMKILNISIYEWPLPRRKIKA